MSKFKDASHFTDELIELKVFGLAAGLDTHRPTLLFKSLCGTHTLGVALSPAEASVSVALSGLGSEKSSHDLTMKVFDKLKVHPVKCIFSDVEGPRVYVTVEFNTKKMGAFTCLADEAVSLCLRAGASFWASLDIINQCKQLEISHLGQGSMAVRDQNRQPYLM